MTRVIYELKGLNAVPTWRWVIAALLGLLGLVAFFSKVEWPADLWLDEATTPGGERPEKSWVPWVGNGTIVVAAVTAFVAPIKGGLSRRRADVELEVADAKKKLLEMASTVFATVAEAEDRPDNALELWKHTTVRVFVVDRSASPHRLTRVADARNHRRTPSGIVWTEGKGVVGIAWRDRMSLFRNLRSRRYLDALSSESSWVAADAALTQGLSFAEATRLAQKPYGAVAAYVVMPGREVLGAVSIDVPPGREYLRLVQRDDVVRQVERLIALGHPEFRALYEFYGARSRV